MINSLSNLYFLLFISLSTYFSRILNDWKICSSTSKVEDAIECYQRAANMFKMAKKWGQAGHAFVEAAQLHAKVESRHDAATNYVDAANCYKKSDAQGKKHMCTSLLTCASKILWLISFLYFQRPSNAYIKQLKYTRTWVGLLWPRNTTKR